MHVCVHTSMCYIIATYHFVVSIAQNGHFGRSLSSLAVCVAWQVETGK